MKLHHKIVAILTSSFVLVGAAVCSFNSTTIFKSVIDSKLNSQRQYLEVVAQDLAKQDNSFKASENFRIANLFANIQNEGLEKYHQFYIRQEDFLNYTAFDYFVQSNATDQIFESDFQFPKSQNCLLTLNVAEKMQDEVLASLKNLNVNLDNFWCKNDSKSKFIGYVINNANDKNYLYIKRITSDKNYVETNLKNAISSLDLKNYLQTKDNKFNSELTIVDNKRRVINSSIDKDAAIKFIEDISDADFETAKSQNIFNMQTNGSNSKLVSIEYLKDDDLYFIVHSNKGSLVKPLIILNFGVVILCALLLALLCTIVLRVVKKQRNDIVNITNHVEIIKANILSTPKELNEITTNFKPNDYSFTPLHGLVNTLNDLTHEIGEKILTQNDSIKEEATSQKTIAVKDALNDQLAQIQKSLMPKASDMPASKFLDIASFMLPSKENLTDFYDIFRVDKDNLGIVMGSCSKPNIPALYAIDLSLNFVKKSLTEDSKLPGQTLTELNRLLMQKDREDLNVSICVMILSEFTGNFIYSQAGLNTPIQIKSESNEVVQLEPKVTAPELCTQKDHEYYESKGKCTYLDSLVFIGHGINQIQNENKEIFDTEKAIDCLKSVASTSAAQTLIGLYKKSHEFGGEALNDRDNCAIVIRKNAKNKEFD